MRTIAAIAAHPSFQAYRAALTNFATLNVTHETGVRFAFQNLLQALAVGEDMTLVPEQVVEGTRARPDGTLRDSYNLPRGDSDPNRADEPEYNVRLVKRVVTVSIETMRIVANLPTRD